MPPWPRGSRSWTRPTPTATAPATPSTGALARARRSRPRPCTAGLLTGKYSHGTVAPSGVRWGGVGTMAAGRWVSPHVEASAATFGLVGRLAEFAAARGRSVLDLAIAALASQPGVASVIAGATTPAQVEANAAAGEWRLTAGDLDAIPAV